jgi:hypothetical protein
MYRIAVAGPGSRLRRGLVPALILILAVSLADAYLTETVNMPMRDGTELVTDIYYPFPGIPPWAAVLSRTPYDRTMDPLMLLYICDLNGYVMVTQSLRGTGGSQGSPAFFKTDGWGEEQDGYDAIEWIAGQWWCSGKVGMWGASAFGITQYCASGAAPPSLQCCAPMIATPFLYRDAAYNGGEFRKCLVENWLDYLGTPWLADTVAAHPNYDISYWGTTDLARRYNEARCPVYHMAGWYDLFTEGQLDAYPELAARHHNQKLFIGPWGHGDAWGNNVQGDLTYPSNAVGDTWFFIGQLLDWYGYWLYGNQNGIMDQPRVMFYLMGDCDTQDTTLWNHWVFADTWPLPNVYYRPYYLRGDGSLTPELPAANEPADTFRYDPRNPCPTIGGREYLGLSGYGPKDQRPLESRPDVLVYTTPVLTEPVTITGKVKMVLFGSSDRRDTDWAVRICDVYPDGRSILVTDGAMMARHRHGLDREDLLVPNEPDTFNVDLWSTALVFNAGHRIRVSVTSSNYPRYERNPNTGAPFRRNDTLNTLVATNVVYHSPALRSQLLLPIWPNGPTTLKDVGSRTEPIGAVSRLRVPSPTRMPLVRLSLRRALPVELSLLDASGRLVERLASGAVPAGTCEYRPARPLPAGVYYVRARIEGRGELKKLVVIR